MLTVQIALGIIIGFWGPLAVLNLRAMRHKRRGRPAPSAAQDRKQMARVQPEPEKKKQPLTIPQRLTDLVPKVKDEKTRSAITESINQAVAADDAGKLERIWSKVERIVQTQDAAESAQKGA